MPGKRGGRRVGKPTPTSPVSAAQADDELKDLANLCGFSPASHLRKGGDGMRGLYAERDLSPGDVVLHVPFTVCLLAEREGGVSGAVELPPLQLAWDLRICLALLEVINGQAGVFWTRYSRLLPTPSDVTLPFCLGGAKRAELHHAALQEAAAAQNERLRTLFPEAMPEEGDDDWEFPNALQWALALVRSRAYEVGPSVWGFVPFLDQVNHATLPSCDFVPNREAGAIELRAIRDVKRGEEVTVSYGSYANQRWMAQYGFVPAGGNAADRLELDGEGLPCAVDVRRVRGGVGVGVAEMASDKGLLAALGTIQDVRPGVSPQGPWDGFEGGQGGDAKAEVRRAQAAAAESSGAEQRAACAVLLAQVEGQLSSCTPLEEDEGLLEGGALAGDPALLAAVAYRVERKRHLGRVKELLAKYDESLA